MIESREQRKAKTLLHRRKVAIAVSLLLAVILIVSSVLIYNYFNSVYYFTDVDEARTEYVIKKVNGVFAMYDKDGNMVAVEKALDSKQIYYVTEFGTMLEIDPETGEYTVKSIPAVNFLEDGEFLDHELLTVFKGVDAKDINIIEVYNDKGGFTLARYDLTKLELNNASEFVLMDSPVSALSKDLLSYITYYVGHPLVRSRLDGAIKDANGEYSEYGLVEMQRTDYEGNVYDYKPASFTITTVDGTKHTLVIGDRLIDGNGYYVQYINNDGVRRDAVYIYNPADMTDVTGSNIQNTILAPAKDLVTPYIAYPSTQNDYFDVSNFIISKRVDGAMQQIVGFSYLSDEIRKDPLLKNHPYEFIESSYTNYHPNYNHIDIALQCLMTPTIVGVEVLSPTNEDKVAYGLMTKSEGEDGNPVYTYDSEYVVSFDKVVTDSVTSEKLKIHQDIYVSKRNEDGNYYTFTRLTFVDAPADAEIKGFSLDSICEVTTDTMDFVEWEPDDWVYTYFAEFAISNIKNIKINSPSYSASFDLIHKTVSNFNVMEIVANYNDNGTTGSIKTFGQLNFKDVYGYDWVITPARIYMYAQDGTEYKPSSRRFEYNSIGEQVHVMDGAARASSGDLSDGALVYVSADYITIDYQNGSEPVKYLRYHNTIFKKMFGSITTTAIVDAYTLSDADELALISNPDNRIATVTFTDSSDTVFTYNFYSITARKAYLTISKKTAADEQPSAESGGFYVPTTRVTKMFSDAKKFFAGIDVDYEAHK